MKKILILGAPRSGTTWLGKIFDSNPNVLYRHEPDSVNPNYAFPFMIDAVEVKEHISAAQEYLHSLCLEKSVRIVGKHPVFKKRNQSVIKFSIRKGLISSIQLFSMLPSIGMLFKRIQVPELIPPALIDEYIYVVKSVISLGRTSLYQKAMNNGHIVLIIRHPCGFVASELRGISSGKLKKMIPFDALASTEEYKKYHLSNKHLEQLDIVEQLSWLWVITNEKALSSLSGNTNVTIVNHDSLCNDPIGETKRLFKACGLLWERQTERFILESSSSKKKSSYYEVKRNSLNEATKWQRELDKGSINKILNITKHTLPGRLFQ